MIHTHYSVLQEVARQRQTSVAADVARSRHQPPEQRGPGEDRRGIRFTHRPRSRLAFS